MHLSDPSKRSDLQRELVALRQRLAETEVALAAKTAEAAAKTAEAAANAAEAAANAATIERLQQRLDALSRRVFGRRSEHIDPRQLLLNFEGAAEAQEAPPPFLSEAPDEETPPAQDERKKRGKKRRNGRARLPGHLPRERKVYDPSPEELTCACCGRAQQAFGEEVTQQLEFRPASFVVIEHVRKKYSCKKCHSGVTTAPLPAAPIERGLPGPGLLAEVITRKYGDHTPLNRLSGIFAREGVSISKQTLCDWIRASAGPLLLKPVYEELRRAVLSSPVIQADETGIRVLRHTIPGRRRGQIWVVGAKPGELCYAYAPTKEGKWIHQLLAGYQGFLQADAAGGFDQLYKAGSIVEVGCNAHARRRFVNAAHAGEAAALWILAAYKKLYAIEREAREEGHDSASRHRLRQEKSKPLIKELYAYLDELEGALRPSSLTAQGIQYAKRHREALCRFLSDGRLEIDNNRAERALRQVALGRVNWTFAGSPAGAERATVLYSLVASCKELGINPAAYLKDVIERIPTHPARLIAELTPRGWLEKQREQRPPDPPDPAIPAAPS